MLVRDLDTGAMISADSMVLNRDTGEMFTPSQLASRVPKALDPHMLRAPPALARAPRVVSLSIDGAAVVGETLRAHVTLDGATSHRLTWRRLWRDGETPPDGGGGEAAAGGAVVEGEAYCVTADDVGCTLELCADGLLGRIRIGRGRVLSAIAHGAPRSPDTVAAAGDAHSARG